MLKKAAHIGKFIGEVHSRKLRQVYVRVHSVQFIVGSLHSPL